MLILKEEPVLIYGISSKFLNDFKLLRKVEVVKLWFEEIDKIYYSYENHIIILSENDFEIIRSSKDCYDKLKILSYRENIILKSSYDLNL